MATDDEEGDQREDGNRKSAGADHKCARKTGQRNAAKQRQDGARAAGGTRGGADPENRDAVSGVLLHLAALLLIER